VSEGAESQVLRITAQSARWRAGEYRKTRIARAAASAPPPSQEEALTRCAHRDDAAASSSPTCRDPWTAARRRP